MAGGGVGGVEAVFEVEAEADGAGSFAASERVRPVRSGTLTSRPWMARRMAMKAETRATSSMASAPKRMLKKAVDGGDLHLLLEDKWWEGEWFATEFIGRVVRRLRW